MLRNDVCPISMPDWCLTTAATKDDWNLRPVIKPRTKFKCFPQNDEMIVKLITESIVPNKLIPPRPTILVSKSRKHSSKSSICASSALMNNRTNKMKLSAAEQFKEREFFAMMKKMVLVQLVLNVVVKRS
jgi:hypothetical protein